VAFCCISTGVFRFPNRNAAEIAIDTVSRWLMHDDSMEKVIFNVFLDKDRELYEKLLS
jgi:O-acetyl-ADP-ribose deacetylase (regulator of RNase III)